MGEFPSSIRRQGLNALISVALTVLMAVPVSGQTVATSFEELRFNVKVGDTVYVTDDSGTSEQRARVLELTASSLAVSIDGVRRDLSERNIQRIRRRLPDSRKNGVLIGFFVGAAASTGAAMRLASPVGSCRGRCAAVNVLYGGGVGALIGLGIDALVQGRRDIYVRRVTQSSRGSALIPMLVPATAAGTGARQLQKVTLSRSNTIFRHEQQAWSERRSWVSRHPVLFGALVGAGVGAVGGATLGHDCGQEEGFCSRQGMMGIGTATGAGLGALGGLVVALAR
jgi:hypothetical protein